MNFKEFFLKDNDQEQFYKNIANKIAEEKNMPKATSLLAEGGFALVFNTTNPNMVVRVADNNHLNNACDYVISKPEIQATGGVNKIFGMFTIEQDDPSYPREFNVMFKEKLNINWQPLFNNVYISTKPLEKQLKISKNRFEHENFLKRTFLYLTENETIPFNYLFSERILMYLYHAIPLKSIIEFLESLGVGPIENLIEAIKKGLHIFDLHENNIALDKNNNLVAIDC